MRMKKHTGAAMLAGALLLPCAQAARLSEQTNFTFTAESLNAGGILMATNVSGTVRLSGSIAQHGFTSLSTNVEGRVLQSGFWWADEVREVEPAQFTGLSLGADQIGITFSVVSGNWYQVLYVTDSQGGLSAGRHSFTNIASALFEATGISTTVWQSVGSPPDTARYYLIKCQ
ncbi:MAG TPA: hypothetical protein PKK36_01845, partial [Kiritimatiellia bacterium]|nr:hypothetical protein [Kiritimatiellia bacterium]